MNELCSQSPLAGKVDYSAVHRLSLLVLVIVRPNSCLTPTHDHETKVTCEPVTCKRCVDAAVTMTTAAEAQRSINLLLTNLFAPAHTGKYRYHTYYRLLHVLLQL